MSSKLSRLLPPRRQLLPHGRALHLVHPRQPPGGVEEEEEEEEGDKEDYYSQLLSAPLPAAASAVRNPTSATTTVAANSAAGPSSQPEPRVIFGSRLVGPAVRRQEGWARERPQEPDNCCMSGCVNCVWDAYREEMEEWAARWREREGGRAGAGGARELDRAQAVAEGGGLFQGVPVGIREFMALEKRLKERGGVAGERNG